MSYGTIGQISMVMALFYVGSKLYRYTEYATSLLLFRPTTENVSVHKNAKISHSRLGLAQEGSADVMRHGSLAGSEV
jgi:hypothetical protein